MLATMTAPDAPRMTAPDTLSLRGAAEACGVSESTIRRNREKLRQNGAQQTANGWAIPRAALIAAGLLTPPDSPLDSPLEPSHETPSDSPRETPHDSPPRKDLDTLHADLANARADAREWRARAEERDREREQLIRRAEAAESTAREATAAAAALALTVKTLETGRQQSETAAQTHPGPQETALGSDQVSMQRSGTQQRPQGGSVRSVWGRARKAFRR